MPELIFEENRVNSNLLFYLFLRENTMAPIFPAESISKTDKEGVSTVSIFDLERSLMNLETVASLCFASAAKAKAATPLAIFVRTCFCMSFCVDNANNLSNRMSNPRFFVLIFTNALKRLKRD